jgi:hypothetical protein
VWLGRLVLYKYPLLSALTWCVLYAVELYSGLGRRLRGGGSIYYLSGRFQKIIPPLKLLGGKGEKFFKNIVFAPIQNQAK